MLFHSHKQHLHVDFFGRDSGRVGVVGCRFETTSENNLLEEAVLLEGWLGGNRLIKIKRSKNSEVNYLLVNNLP